MPRRSMVTRRADAYRVPSSALGTSVNAFVTTFGGSLSHGLMLSRNTISRGRFSSWPQR
jgi:hypothetical protein